MINDQGGPTEFLSENIDVEKTEPLQKGAFLRQCVNNLTNHPDSSDDDIREMVQFGADAAFSKNLFWMLKNLKGNFCHITDFVKKDNLSDEQKQELSFCFFNSLMENLADTGGPVGEVEVDLGNPFFIIVSIYNDSDWARVGRADAAGFRKVVNIKLPPSLRPEFELPSDPSKIFDEDGFITINLPSIPPDLPILAVRATPASRRKPEQIIAHEAMHEISTAIGDVTRRSNDELPPSLQDKISPEEQEWMRRALLLAKGELLSYLITRESDYDKIRESLLTFYQYFNDEEISTESRERLTSFYNDLVPEYFKEAFELFETIGGRSHEEANDFVYTLALEPLKDWPQLSKTIRIAAQQAA